MCDPDERTLVVRVSELEGKLSKTRWTAIIGILAAIIALVGHWVPYTNATRGIDNATRGTDIGKNDLAIDVQRLRSQNLHAMTVSYEQTKATLKRIATLYGIETAVRFELPFRTGATIRALEEIQENLPNNSKTDHHLIASALSDVPLVLFIDSRLPDNIFCDESIKISATNVDDIVELVKDLPVRIVGQIGDRVGMDTIVQNVKKEKPTLVVMHMDAFEGLPDQGADVEKTSTFLRRLVADGFQGSVIVYARKKTELKHFRKAFLDSKLIENLVTVQLKSDSKSRDAKDENCFGKDKVNGSRIVRAIRSAIRFEDLYTRGSWSNKPLQATQ